MGVRDYDEERREERMKRAAAALQIFLSIYDNTEDSYDKPSWILDSIEEQRVARFGGIGNAGTRVITISLRGDPQ